MCYFPYTFLSVSHHDVDVGMSNFSAATNTDSLCRMTHVTIGSRHLLQKAMAMGELQSGLCAKIVSLANYHPDAL